MTNFYAKLEDIADLLEGPGSVIVCAGPPTCLFQGDQAIEAQENGCPKCRRIRVSPDGSEEEYRTKEN